MAACGAGRDSRADDGRVGELDVSLLLSIMCLVQLGKRTQKWEGPLTLPLTLSE